MKGTILWKGGLKIKCFDFLYSFYPKQLLFQEDVSEISSKV